ncbi:sensor histidine kinase [Actinomadura sp. DC4]|uniref:sensor histidine kinase n=1 Tax=Actinomadura sp. DC4 TaxID=3055069 RepID=UPI0025B0DF47|nr:sensor histidine kinase [Actinomadura sp. DC4]MDN3356018.1 sensor histidine kinase [Actinomadura sp. DC4]
MPVTRRLRAIRTSMDTAVRSLRVDCGEVRELAEERGALQYVATLVARGSPPSVIFEAAASALGGLIRADYVAINRREADGIMSIVAIWRAPGTPDPGMPFGGRWPLAEDTASAEVLRNRRPARRASAAIRSDIGGWHREHGISYVVASPLVINDRLWGTMSALYLSADPPDPATEERMGKFVELLNCAITQATTHAELIHSRASLLTSVDATRHRIERDLHDGAQQHLISLALRLREAEEDVPPDLPGLRGTLSATAQGLAGVLGELQEIAGGLRPPALARQGLRTALPALVSRCAVPVDLHVGLDRRLPEELEVALYYVVSEALTNVLKHAYATGVRVELGEEDAKVRLAVRDNGVGGADPARGSGLNGLRDRVAAVGGSLQVASPAGQGTTLIVTIPNRLPGSGHIRL